MKNLGYYNGKYDEIEKMQIPMLDRVCWFGAALFQVIKCRLAGEDTDRIDSCIDTAGDVCVDAVTDDHGVLFGDAELF